MLTPATLWPQLTSDTVIVTSSLRLPSQLLEQHSIWLARTHPTDCWETPQIVPLDIWLSQLAEQALLTGQLAVQDYPTLLLSAQQARLVWEEVLAAQPEAERLLNTAGLADALAEARALLLNWQLDVPEHLRSYEYQVFHTLHERYQARLHTAHWLDAPAWLALRIEWLMQQKLPVSARRVVFAGFDEFTPQQQRLRQALLAQGVTVETLDNGAPATHLMRVACDDPAQEIALAARWAQAHLAHAPHARLAIVVPDLEARRDEIERTLLAVFHPEHRTDTHPQRARIFNLSLGRPLGHTQLVRTALDLYTLLLHPQRIPFTTLTALLRSPYWGRWPQDYALRGEAEARLRRLNRSDWSLNALADVLPQLAYTWDALKAAAPAFQGARPLDHWLETLAEHLPACGWPGTRPRSSEDFQLLNAFQDTVDTLAALTPIRAQFSASEVLQQLRRLCQEQLFQAQASGKESVHILGVFEAAGSQFDAVWVCGMDDSNWPAAPRPNPFLPAPLQREAGLPHASAARELAFAQRVLTRLMASAPEVYFSHPKRRDDISCTVSPLISPLPELDSASLPAPIEPPPAITLEAVHDPHGIPLVGNVTLAGGTDFFKQQAHSPLLGYARHRLGARSLDSPHDGLDSAERGSLLHRVLYQFWHVTQDQATLLAYSEERCQEVIAGAVEQALSDDEKESKRRLPTHFRRLEAARLAQRLSDWLVQERTRAPFAIEALEHEVEITIDGLSLRTRIDRIDRLLADDRLVIIDYKTGQVDNKNWLAERLLDPQLPLYAVHANAHTPLAALAFASLKVGALGWQGFSATPDAPGLKPPPNGDWDRLLSQWQTACDTLAAEIRAGLASNQLYIAPDKLRYADARPLLRLAEHETCVSTTASQGLSIVLDNDAGDTA